MIAAVVLAAGLATRFGSCKQLLRLGADFKAGYLVEVVVNRLLSSQIEEIVVVTGNQYEKISDVLADKAVELSFNPDYKLGLSSSIKQGIKEVEDLKQLAGVLFTPADMPHLTSSVIDDLLNDFRKNSSSIVVPEYQGQRGNPVIFPKSLLAELKQVKGDKGGREIIKQNPDLVRRVEVASDEVIFDIDTKKDYQKFLERINEG